MTTLIERARERVKAEWARRYSKLALWQESDPEEYEAQVEREAQFIAAFATEEIARSSGPTDPDASAPSAQRDPCA